MTDMSQIAEQQAADRLARQRIQEAERARKAAEAAQRAAKSR